MWALFQDQIGHSNPALQLPVLYHKAGAFTSCLKTIRLWQNEFDAEEEYQQFHISEAILLGEQDGEMPSSVFRTATLAS